LVIDLVADRVAISARVSTARAFGSFGNKRIWKNPLFQITLLQFGCHKNHTFICVQRDADLRQYDTLWINENDDVSSVAFF
jgi:hypothetical protein